MLIAKELTKKFGPLTALDGLNLSVGTGEVFCLLGANGAGKTTTINLFMGFIRPSAGKATINGLDVQNQAAETKKYLAYIPETLNLYGNLTGVENLQFFAGLSTSSLAQSDAEELLKSVGLQSDLIHHRVKNYSKGMRQKIGIAIAQAKQAQCLLLDEPTSGLDPKASNDFASLIHEMRERGVATLMTTHDLFRAKDIGTHIGIMKSGKLIHELKSNEVSLSELEQLYLDTMKSEQYVTAPN